MYVSHYSTLSLICNTMEEGGYLKSGILCAIWGSTSVENVSMRPINGRPMLPETLYTRFVYLRKGWKHFIGNGCLSSQYIIPFAILRGYPKSDYLCVMLWELISAKTLRMRTISGRKMLTEAPLIYLMPLMNALKHFTSNACVSLQYSTPFAILRGYPQFRNLCSIWESPWWKMTHYDPHVPSRCFESTFHLSHVSNKGLQTPHRQCVTLIAVYHPIYCTGKVPESGILCTIWESMAVENTQWDQHVPCRCYQKLLPSALCI